MRTWFDFVATFRSFNVNSIFAENIRAIKFHYQKHGINLRNIKRLIRFSSRIKITTLMELTWSNQFESCKLVFLWSLRCHGLANMTFQWVVMTTRLSKHKLFCGLEMATILFDLSKNELFKLTDNYKTVNRKLKANYKTEV